MTILRRFGVWVISSKVKARNSIRVKISMMVVVFSVFIIAASWLLCSYVLSGVFLYSVKNNLIATYNSCNALFQGENSNAFDDGELFGQISNPQDAVVMIVDANAGKLYTSINDEGQMMEGMRILLKSIQSEDSETKFKKGEYVIRKNHDTVTNADYYDLIGRLDNGYDVLLRTPIARVESVMKVMTRLFVYICIGLLIFGAIFMLLFSNIFAAPIKRMSKAAKRMTQLDFDVRIPVMSNDEIGELGNSMNEMSEKLEHTISELKSANLELQRDIDERRKIDDMRKEFLSHVSHELKTPIALIQGYAEGLKDNLFDDAESREFYTDVIIDESRKMNTMVKRLLTLNEIEFGETKLNIERFELVGFINAIIASTKILAEEKNAEILFEDTEPVYVWADEYMMEEVFTNYLTNAIHYVRQDGVIRVGIERMEKDVRVYVYNQGDWIAEEDIDRVFDKFYKADKARTREYGGNGIGLSIVAATMKAHGKDYGVKNVADGVLFYFDLDANVLADNEK